ncbi:hypothetical protein E2F46_06330 [Luteimonas aestuarii]|uniref:Uncharacterized protein n=1 Tax=Luteimonas aestuarii TaxID=453837 RepID=A0A4R5TYH6_9GAMM|nr:hypothetical protein [Luteimonas aestuarii]TDK26211.1 hypothetical protein E2F46_06330 [Luteimonas aestuarii]
MARLLRFIEDNPEAAEAMVETRNKPIDLDQWKILLDEAVKLWPEGDEEFVLALHEGFLAGLTVKGLKEWIEAYRRGPASSLPIPD